MPSAVWMPWALRGIRAVADLVGAWVLARLVRRMLGRLRGYTMRVMDRRGNGSTIEMENRAATIVSVLTKLSSLVIWLIAIW